MWQHTREEKKESQEDYLEIIYILDKKHPNTVRQVDIARALHVKKPSVSRAVALLGKEGYVYRAENGNVKLTEKGEEIAKSVYEKHKLFTDVFLKCAEVSPQTAEKDACRVEHIISEETFQGMKSFLEAFE